MSLYCYIIWLAKEIAIDEIWIWFIRNQQIKKFKFDENLVLKVLDWLDKTYNAIQEDKKWIANNKKDNQYFCKFLCSVSDSCQYKPQ